MGGEISYWLDELVPVSLDPKPWRATLMKPEFGEMTPARRANVFMARFERVSHLGESGSFFDGSSQFLRALLSPRQGEGRTCGLLNLQRRTVLFGVQSSKVENIPYLAIKRFLVHAPDGVQLREKQRVRERSRRR